MNENKKAHPVLWIIIILLLIAVGVGGWYLGTKMANKEDKQSSKETNKEENNNEKTNEETKNDLIYLSVLMDGTQGLTGIYADGTAKLISDKVVIDRFTVDENLVYYVNPKGDVFSLDLNNPEAEPKSYKANVGDHYFSVVKGKAYYLEVKKSKVNAVLL